MEKEEVFELMGKYYGNAYYRSANRLHYTREDLLLTKSLLDQVNALGYRFSNVHSLQNVEDARFLPIILHAISQYKSDDFKGGLLQAICHRSYHSASSELIKLYDEPSMRALRWNISDALFRIRTREMIPALLEIVKREQYGEEPDRILEILIRYKVDAALEKLKALMEKNPFWENLFLRYAASFRDPTLIGLVEQRMEAEDPYMRTLAKKAITKMKRDLEEKNEPEK